MLGVADDVLLSPVVAIAKDGIREATQTVIEEVTGGEGRGGGGGEGGEEVECDGECLSELVSCCCVVM